MPHLSGLQVAIISVILIVLIYIMIRAADRAGTSRSPPPALYPRAVRVMRIFGGVMLRRELLRHIQNAGILTDAQNVHDSTVVKCISGKYKRLVELQPDVESDLIPTLADITIGEIEAAAKLAHDEPTCKQIADTTAHIRGAAATISSLGPEPIREIEVLVRVQLRIDDITLDAETRKALWEILLKQLLDMREGENYVCVTGRVSRMLNVFTIVDPDPVLAEAELSATQLQSAIINRAHAIMAEELDADPEMRKTYDESEILPEHIATHIKNKLQEKLHNEYKDKVDAVTLAKLIEESQQAIA